MDPTPLTISKTYFCRTWWYGNWKSIALAKTGKACYIDVPLGTIVKDAETRRILFEITEEGEDIYRCKGGMGGRGNSHFKSPTNQSTKIRSTWRRC